MSHCQYLWARHFSGGEPVVRAKNERVRSKKRTTDPVVARGNVSEMSTAILDRNHATVFALRIVPCGDEIKRCPRPRALGAAPTLIKAIGRAVSGLLSDTGFHPLAAIAPKCAKLGVCVDLRKDGNKLHGRTALRAPCLRYGFVRGSHGQLNPKPRCL
jgi:hypothetical protein